MKSDWLRPAWRQATMARFDLIHGKTLVGFAIKGRSHRPNPTQRGNGLCRGPIEECKARAPPTYPSVELLASALHLRCS